MSNQLASQEETEQLYQILSLLEVTFSSDDTSQIKSAQDKLQTYAQNFPVFTSLLYKSLFITTLKDKQISINLHKSAVIYLRNILLKNANTLKAEDIFHFIKNFSLLLFSWEKNNNLYNSTISMILQNIVHFLLSLEVIYNNPTFIETLFSEISKILLEDNKQYTNENNILITCEKIIGLSESLLTSKSCDGKNYKNLTEKYFFPIADKILNLGKQYINPSLNIYNAKYCLIIKNLFDCLYNIVSNFKSFIDNDSFKNINLVVFKKYWQFCYELIKLNPPLDEESKTKFGNSNPIIVLNIDEKKCNEINSMKSRVIQLNCYLIQSICTISNDLEFRGNTNSEITDKDLISFIINMIKLIVNSFEDLLSNKEKFYYVRNYENEVFKEDNNINILLYELCVFLTRVLIRQPFKDTFRSDIKLFLLNILFPLFSTNDTEKNSIEKDYEMYHMYLDDMIEHFKMKKFRISGIFLISKICNFFPDDNNFILSFSLEMFNYTINNGNINNEINYNVYLENKNKYMIDKLDDETKIDFFLLLLLVLKDKISKNILIKNHLREYLIKNQLKLHQIQSLTIKIKICKLYSFYIPLLFKEEEDININTNNISIQKKILDKNKNNNINNKLNNEENNKNNFIEEHFKFIQNAIDYLLNNISQNFTLNDKSYKKDNYYQSLSHFAAESISDLIISFTKDEENEEDNIVIKNENEKISLVNNYIYKCLSDNFKTIINLILIIDNSSFYNLIDYTLKKVKSKERDDIFICLNNITEKFIKDLNKNKDNEEENTPFIVEYFKILSDFLKGVNKLNKNDKKEIQLFEEILNKVFTHININELEKFEENDELIETIEDYINLVGYVNEKSINVFKKILAVLKKDNMCSNSLFSFLCTIMKYLPKTNNLDANIKSQLINEIIEIIKITFTFKDELYDNSIRHALLLTLKLFNICINEIPFDILKDLLIKSLNAFTPITKEDLYIGDFTEKIIINQLILSNVSFGFIFQPSYTYKIIFEKNNDTPQNAKNAQKEQNPQNAQNPENKDKKGKDNINPYLTLYINLILHDIGAANTDYIILLNKCIILGLCSMFKEKYCVEKLNEDINIKILILQIFAKLIEKHKKQQVEQLNKIMKKETNCNFIEEQENEDDDDDEEDDEDLEDIKETIQDILSENKNIKNADEYKYFYDIMSEIKNKESNIYKVINDSFNGELEELLLIRNININYKGKDFTVPRKTVKILKNKK